MLSASSFINEVTRFQALFPLPRKGALAEDLIAERTLHKERGWISSQHNTTEQHIKENKAMALPQTHPCLFSFIQLGRKISAALLMRNPYPFLDSWQALCREEVLHPGSS